MQYKDSERWRSYCLVLMLLMILCLSPTLTSGQQKWYTIQIASVVSEAEARDLLNALRSKGIAAYAVRAEVKGLGSRYRIRYGRFRTQLLARTEAERESGRGSYSDFIITYEEPDSMSRKIDAPPVKNSVESRSDKATIEAPRTPEPRPVAEERAVKTAPMTAILEPKSGPAKAPARTAAPRVGLTVPELISNNRKWAVTVPDTLPEERWSAIQFIDGLTGWIGGVKGSLYRTNDGGHTWRRVTVESSGKIISINLADWNSGWVLADGPAESEDAGVKGRQMLITHNGGRTWRQYPLGGVERVVRIDGQRGLALGRGGQLWRTTDGGDSWGRVEKPFGTGQLDRLEMVDIAASDGESGVEAKRAGASWPGPLWMIANERTVTEETRPGSLWRSVDDGQSWSMVKLPGELTARQGRFLSVRFQSAKSGTLTGEMVQSEGRSWFILSTNDGGASWKLEMQSGRELAQAQFTERSELSRTLYAGRGASMAGHGWTQTATIEADATGNSSHIESHLLTTLDGGRTWREEFRLIGRHALLASFIREDRGWVMTERGVLLSLRMD